MKIKILEKTDKEIKFSLEDSNPQFANALRRIMTVEVPILAINSVDFSVNDSVLYNEVIAHRLGLIPLVFNPKDFDFKEEGEKSSSSTEVIFAINKKGPCMIYSKDMKSSNPDVKPLYDNIPIIELFDGQKLKLEASASLGLGLNHARYQAAIAFYRYYPTAKVNGKITNPEEIVKACPRGDMEIKDNKVSVDPDCDLCNECLKFTKPEGAIELLGDNTKFIFNIETVSGLKPEEIILISTDILKKKVKDFDKEIDKV